MKIVVGNKEVIIISDRHPALLRSVPEVTNHCYHHVNENFSSFLSKHNTQGNKGKKNALQFIDRLAYGRLDHDYNISMFQIKKYNEALATWVGENAPHHGAMSKFPKQRWDKMTTNLAESFNVWLWNERHHSICNFLLEHMSKLASMLVKHKEESKNWKGCIAQKLKIRGWQMLGIPREHVIIVIISISQNVTDFVDDWYKYPMQELIYEGSFSGIETHNMPSVDDDDQERSALSPNFTINGLCIALVVICPTTIEKPARILCPKCIFVTLFHSADLVYSISTNLSELVVTKSALVFEYFVPLPSLAMFIE
ncbi:hypothetical protein AAG906_000955 [Vitis piasezkii]